MATKKSNTDVRFRQPPRGPTNLVARFGGHRSNSWPGWRRLDIPLRRCYDRIITPQTPNAAPWREAALGDPGDQWRADPGEATLNGKEAFHAAH